MEKKVRVDCLLDLYGALLTERQKDVMEAFASEDLSVSEIAESFSISRQAASEMVRRTEGILEAYEEKLGMFARLERCRELLGELSALIGEGKAQELIEALGEEL